MYTARELSLRNIQNKNIYVNFRINYETCDAWSHMSMKFTCRKNWTCDSNNMEVNFKISVKLWDIQTITLPLHTINFQEKNTLIGIAFQ